MRFLMKHTDINVLNSVTNLIFNANVNSYLEESEIICLESNKIHPYSTIVMEIL